MAQGRSQQQDPPKGTPPMVDLVDQVVRESQRRTNVYISPVAGSGLFDDAGATQDLLDEFNTGLNHSDLPLSLWKSLPTARIRLIRMMPWLTGKQAILLEELASLSPDFTPNIRPAALANRLHWTMEQTYWHLWNVYQKGIVRYVYLDVQRVDSGKPITQSWREPCFEFNRRALLLTHWAMQAWDKGDKTAFKSIKLFSFAGFAAAGNFDGQASSRRKDSKRAKNATRGGVNQIPQRNLVDAAPSAFNDVDGPMCQTPNCGRYLTILHTSGFCTRCDDGQT